MMQTTTLSFEKPHNHGALFAKMLRAKRELVIVHNQWDLPEALWMEYDQYDTPASRWVVVHDELGRVLAGNRLTPTIARCGICSCTIREAQRGLFDAIPTNLLHAEAPVAETLSESSRLFVTLDLPAAIRRLVHARLISEPAKASRLPGATQCMALLAAKWPLWAGRVGADMTAMGPVMENDGIDDQVLSMGFSNQLHRACRPLPAGADCCFQPFHGAGSIAPWQICLIPGPKLPLRGRARLLTGCARRRWPM